MILITYLHNNIFNRYIIFLLIVDSLELENYKNKIYD